MNTIVISTINHRIQPLMRQLNAILGGPSCWKVETVGTSTHPPTRARHYFWLESITCIVAGAHGEVREDLEYS